MTVETCELQPLADPADALFRWLPVPGSGETAARFSALWDFGARSPSLGRVAEAHHDAQAILAEAGRSDVRPGVHGVWAAGGPDPLLLERAGSGTWRMHGSKHWCSAATLATVALVTASGPDGTGALVRVELAGGGVRVGESTWRSPAMTAVETRTVHFDVIIEEADIVGVEDWYLTRPGFWHGAIGVAACWAGCVDGVIDRLMRDWRDDPHASAHLGAIDAARWNLRVVIKTAADEIDADPIGTAESRSRRALRVRHLVDAAITDIHERIGRALGPGPLAHSTSLHRHMAETDLYRRQSHAERDLEVLGRLTRIECT